MKTINLLQKELIDKLRNSQYNGEYLEELIKEVELFSKEEDLRKFEESLLINYNPGENKRKKGRPNQLPADIIGIKDIGHFVKHMPDGSAYLYKISFDYEGEKFIRNLNNEELLKLNRTLNN